MNSGPPEPARSHGAQRRKTQNHSEAADARTNLVKKIMDDERKTVDAKTAKLRAQRLAKEEEERVQVTAELAAAPAPKRRTKAKPAN